MSVKLKRTAAQSSTSTPQCKSSDDKRRQGAASSSTAAGKKRSRDDAGLDEPALTTPVVAKGASKRKPVPVRCAPPERVMATARTISLVVTLPDDSGAALTELECEYTIDGASRATKETFKVDDPSAKQQVITLGARHSLSLASRISSVRVKAANEHGCSAHFSPAAFDDEPLYCSPLDASLEELQALLQEADPQASRLEVLKQFLSKKRTVPQLKWLAADRQIEGLTNPKKEDIIDSIVESSQGGGVDAAVLAAVTRKEQACAAAKAKLQETQRELDRKQAVVNSEDASVRRAEAARDAATDALAKAQAKADAAEEVLKEKQSKAKTAKKAATTALEEHEKGARKVANAEAALDRVALLQEALKQAEAAPKPPPATLAIVDKSSGLDSADLASGRPAPEKLTPLKLKNRIKKWAESDVISASSLQQCYKALGNSGRRDKATLIAELFGSYEGTVAFLRLPLAIPDQKLTLIPDKMLALIYTSNRDLLPPPPADGKDRAAMVNELASWLLLPRSSPTTTAIDATFAPSADQAAITTAIVNVATLASPAEVTNQAAITSTSSSVTLVQERQPSLAPLELLIVACTPWGVQALPNVQAECHEISSKMPMDFKEAVSPSEVRDILSTVRTKRFLFSGHADAQLNHGERTLAFTSLNGGLAVIEPHSISHMLGGFAQKGDLDLVFLNGCCSAELGKAVLEAGVPNVVCWESPTSDDAARIFSVAPERPFALSSTRDADPSNWHAG